MNQCGEARVTNDAVGELGTKGGKKRRYREGEVVNTACAEGVFGGLFAVNDDVNDDGGDGDGFTFALSVFLLDILPDPDPDPDATLTKPGSSI